MSFPEGEAAFLRAEGSDVLHAVGLAGRDLEWSENGGLREPGIVAAHEQISISGILAVEGFFIAESACDTSGSPVASSVISGNPTVRSDSGLEAHIPGGSDAETTYSEWSEVR